MQIAAAIQKMQAIQQQCVQEDQAFSGTVLFHVLSNVQFARLVVTCAPFWPSAAHLADVLAAQLKMEDAPHRALLPAPAAGK